MAIIRIKNLYKFDKDANLMSFVFSYDLEGNYDNYGHSRNFQFNSDK